jgi:hypothetical protein
MNLISYYGKKVKIIADNNSVFYGTVNDYIYPESNEEGKESIIIDTINGSAIEFYEEHIKSIEIVK